MAREQYGEGFRALTISSCIGAICGQDRPDGAENGRHGGGVIVRDAVEKDGGGGLTFRRRDYEYKSRNVADVTRLRCFRPARVL